MEADRRQEQLWISRCLNGEPQDFRPLVERYERMVRSVIRRLIDAEHEVDELAQQTFVIAYENLAQYQGESRFSTWLCQIALNKCRDQLRVRRRRREDLDIAEVELASEANGPEASLAGKQLDGQLQAALRKLRRTDRELIVFKYIAGHSYETVGRIFGCTPAAAKVRSVRAREVLKKVLRQMGIAP